MRNCQRMQQVYLTKPLGLRFARGNDGAAYIVGSNPRVGDTDDQIEVGDLTAVTCEAAQRPVSTEAGLTCLSPK